MITQKIKLNLIPNGIMPRFNVSQYDYGSRTLEIALYNGTQPFEIPTGANVVIQGTKKDHRGFQYEEQSFTGNTVYADLTQQMTVFEDEVLTELVILVDDEQLATANFIINVEEAALKDDVVVSETDIPAIQTLPEAMEEVRQAVIHTAADAQSASNSADDAEAWAVGTINGQAVPDSDPRHNNNSEYYAHLAETASESVVSNVDNAEAWAVGTKQGVPVASTDPQYHNNSKYHAEQADTSATNAATSETNAHTSELNAASSKAGAAASALVSEGWAKGTQNGTPVTSGSPYYEDNSKYYSQLSDADRLAAEGHAVGQQNGVDVDSSSPYYHNNAKYYKDQAQAIAAQSLSALSDVAIENPANGQALIYEDGEWVNKEVANSYEDLTDTEVTNLQVLDKSIWNGSKWVNVQGGELGEMLNPWQDDSGNFIDDGTNPIMLRYDAMGANQLTEMNLELLMDSEKLLDLGENYCLCDENGVFIAFPD